MACAAGSVYAQSEQPTNGISLPTEFFWGRWSGGFSATGSGQFKENFAPGWATSATFDRGPLRAEFEGVVVDSGYYWLPYSISNGSLALAYRLPAPMQFRIGVRRYDSDVRRPQSGEPYHRYKWNEESLTLGFDWSRHHTIEIPRENAAYSYLVAPMPARGEAFLTADVFASDNDYSERSYGIPEDAGEHRITEAGTVCSTFVAATYAPGDRLRLAAHLSANLSDNRHTVDWIASHPDVQDQKNETTEEQQELVYALSVVYRAYHSLFISGEVSQRLSGTQNRARRLHPDDGTGWDRSDPFALRETRLSATFDFLTEGNFVPSVILDDYQNYYRHMVFHHQLHARVSVETGLPGAPHYSEQNTLALSGEVSYGLFPFMEVSGKASYQWNDAARNGMVYPSLGWYPPPELVTSAFGLRLRTFQHGEAGSPDWSTADQMDIAFGPILRAGHAWVDLTYVPPELMMDMDDFDGSYVGVFAFDHLIRFDTETATINGELGVGRRTSVGATLTKEFLYWHPDPYSISARIRHRPISTVEIAIGYQCDRDRYRRDSREGHLTISGVF